MFKSNQINTIESLKAHISNFHFNYAHFKTQESIDAYRQAMLEAFFSMLALYTDETLKQPTIVDLIQKKVTHILKQGKARKQQLEITEEPANRQLTYRLNREEIQLVLNHQARINQNRCYVIDGNLAVKLKSFFANVVKNGARRTQLIFKETSSQHWSTLDILKTDSAPLQVFFVDTIGSKTNYEPLKKLCMSNHYALTASMGGIQADNSSCSIFTLDHAIDMAHIHDLHQQVAHARVQEEDGTYSIQALQLPPALVKNAQSTSFIRRYLEQNPNQADIPVNNEGLTLLAYAESEARMINGKKIYNAIKARQKAYRTAVNKYQGKETPTNYDEILRAEAEQTLLHTKNTIERIDVDYSTCNSREAFDAYQAMFQIQMEEALKSRRSRDAETILNVLKPVGDMAAAIESKREAIEHNPAALTPTTFKTEKERQKHHEAACIPKAIWHIFFKQALSPQSLALMQTEPSEINEELIKINATVARENAKECAWLAVASRHPSLPANTLMQYFKTLGFSPETELKLAVMLGKADLVNEVLTQNTKGAKSLIQIEDYYTFRYAAQHGFLPVIERFVQVLREPKQIQAMLKARNYAAFREAAKHGRIDVIDYFFTQQPSSIEAMIVTKNYHAFQLALEHGHLDVIMRLINRLGEIAPEKVQQMVAVNHDLLYTWMDENRSLTGIDELTENLRTYGCIKPERREQSMLARALGIFGGASTDGIIGVAEASAAP